MRCAVSASFFEQARAGRGSLVCDDEGALLPAAHREAEGGFDLVDVGFLAVADDDFDDVEAVVDVLSVEQADPAARSSGDEFFLVARDGVGGAAPAFLAARFYFGEDEFVSGGVAADDVHFAAGFGAEVFAEDLVTVLAEKFRGEFFATASECVAGVRAPAWLAGRGEKIGDELDKAHAVGVR